MAAASTAAAASATAASAAETSAAYGLGGNVRAGRQDFCEVYERASDTRSRSCASQQSRKCPPVYGLLSERHGEGAAAQSFELSSQTLGFFQVYHGYVFFGGCHCRLGRRRLGVL